MASLQKAQSALSDIPLPVRDLEHGKRNMDEYGYTIHENFITPDEVIALRERLIEQAELEVEHGVAILEDRSSFGFDPILGAEQAPKILPVQDLVFLVNKGRVFIELANSPLARAYLQHIFRGCDFQVSAQVGMVIRKGAKLMNVHSDQNSFPFNTPIPNAVNIMVCLSDFDENMGATRLVPKSHLLAPPKIVPHPNGGVYNPEPIETVPAVTGPGSAIIFESRTWHCSGASTSDKIRYSISNSYAHEHIKPIDTHSSIVHDDVYASMSEQERELYGFREGHGFVGRLGPRYLGDKRHNTNTKFPFVPELHRGKKAEVGW